MHNMLIWICITTPENVTKQWCTGSNKIMQFMPRFTQPELEMPSGPHCDADTIHLPNMILQAKEHQSLLNQQ